MTQHCPWQWRHLHCALPPRHPSPHHIIGEQPDFDRIEQVIAQQERQRLRALAWHPYSDRGGDGIQYGQCLVCGEDGLSEADVDAFFAEPSKEATA